MDGDSDPTTPSPSPSPSPSPNRPDPQTLTLTSITIASTPPPQQTLTLALPIQTTNPNPNPNPNSTGREDCWSDGATSALIDSWGARHLLNRRGKLNHKQWLEVSDTVTSRNDRTKNPKTDIQCKNRIGTLKKKYKSERSKPSDSSWPFFRRLDRLIGPTEPNPNPNPAPVSSESSDSIPQMPAAAAGARGGVMELTRAVIRLGEVYEKVERSKTRQAVEIERQRMGFVRELELQRMEFFTKTQMELSRLKRKRRRHDRGGSFDDRSGNNHHRHRGKHGNDGGSDDD